MTEDLLLTPAEARVLGVLIEKAATTPDQYPLTANAAMVGANQKTSREPIMDLELGEVGHALRTLEDKKLVRVQHASRAYRYEYRMDEVYQITPPQRAVLCVLVLRGAQTAGEIFARSDRIGRFTDIEQVKDTLDRLGRRTPALVLRLGKQPGQREERFMHLLCGAAYAEKAASAVRSDDHPATNDLASRVSALEDEVAQLRARIDALSQASSQ